MLDNYFKRPLFWDYTIATIITAVFIIFYYNKILTIPKEEYLFSISSDLSTVALTLAGFILTLITVLISFKVGNSKKRNLNVEEASLFEIFFNTELYNTTVGFLKNCIKSLMFVAVLGYSIKLLFNFHSYLYLYFYIFFGLMIIIFTLWRSLLILTKILEIQQDDEDE